MSHELSPLSDPTAFIYVLAAQRRDQIAALKERLHKALQENKELRKELEAAYADLRTAIGARTYD